MMEDRDAATIAGAGVGGTFGPDLFQWLADVFVASTGWTAIPAMPESVVLAIGTALGAVLTRWYWSWAPPQREMFPKEDEGE